MSVKRRAQPKRSDPPPPKLCGTTGKRTYRSRKRALTAIGAQPPDGPRWTYTSAGTAASGT